MSAPEQPPPSPPTVVGGISLRAIPRWVWLLALLVGLGRMTPWAVSAIRTPPGWTFTGNLSMSPDYMQYRTWSRQSQVEGPILTNRFTAEPNRAFLPVPLYWAIGQLSRLTGMTPEWVYAWLGAPLAALLVVLLYATVRRFVRSATALRWTLGTMLLAGGLGGVLLFIRSSPALSSWYPFSFLIVEPMSGPARAVPLEGYRGNYVVSALVDTHFLAYWVAALAAVMALINVVFRWSRGGLAVMGALFAGATILHIYEGVTLAAITAGVLLAAWSRGLALRRAVLIATVALVSVGSCLGAAFLLHAASGLPSPTWRGLAIPPLIVLLGFPVTWLLVATGGARWWREGAAEAPVLLGWAAGCLALVLSGPFFPYPDRGTMTLQVPMLLIAAAIYFRSHTRVRPLHALLLVLLSGSTIALQLHRIRTDWFNPDEPYQWVNADHVRVVRTLSEQSGPEDLLLADEATLRWLAPEYTGRHFAGHFFLTVDYERKRTALEQFLRDRDTTRQLAFLHESGATWLFVPRPLEPERFELLPGVDAVAGAPFGTLFSVDSVAVARAGAEAFSGS